MVYLFMPVCSDRIILAGRWISHIVLEHGFTNSAAAVFHVRNMIWTNSCSCSYILCQSLVRNDQTSVTFRCRGQEYIKEHSPFFLFFLFISQFPHFILIFFISSPACYHHEHPLRIVISHTGK